jgi:WD40 repeat protein
MLIGNTITACCRGSNRLTGYWGRYTIASGVLSISSLIEYRANVKGLVYLDFDLLIESEGEVYQAYVQNSPAGQARLNFESPFSILELENFYLRLGRPRRELRRLASPEMESAREHGAKLFETIFKDAIYGCLRASLSAAQAQGKGLRLRLRLNAAELADLPWEYLYDPHQGQFLSLSTETPIVRYLEMPQLIPVLAAHPPLKILVMIANPSDYPPLDVKAEWKALCAALRSLERRGLVTVERLEHATLTDLRRQLRRDEYNILHFIGHGKFDEHAQDGLLVFENDQGCGCLHSGWDLGILLHDHRSLRLVVLNACEGARTSLADPFAGVAHSLLQKGIPAVIAMQFAISNRAAITLSRELYTALADGYPVDVALTEARKAIFSQKADQETDIEWGAPVLFTRLADGQIFDLEPVSVTSHPSNKPQVRDLGGLLQRPIAWLWLVVGLVLLAILLTGLPGLLGQIGQAGGSPTASWVQSIPHTNTPTLRLPAPPEGEPTAAAAQKISTGLSAWTPSPPVSLPDDVSLIAHLGQGIVEQVIWSPDGKTLAFASSIGVYLYDADTLQERQFIDTRTWVRSVAFGPAGDVLAMGGDDRVVRVWSVDDGEYLWGIPDDSVIDSLAFSADGRLLASTSGAEAKLWKADNGALVRVFQKNGFDLYNIALSPDGTMMAASNYQAIQVWDVVSGQPSFTMTLESGEPKSLVFSPDGSRLVSAGGFQGDPIRLWDAADGRLIQAWGSFDGAVNGAALSPDGRLLATAGSDGAVRVYQVGGGQLVATLA